MTSRKLTLFIVVMTLLTAGIHFEHYFEHQTHTVSAAEVEDQHGHDAEHEAIPHSHADGAQDTGGGLMPLSSLILLNALGYLVLMAAFVINLPLFVANRRITAFALMGYAVLTLLAWVWIGDRVLAAYIAKGAEVLLIGALMLYLRLPEHSLVRQTALAH